MYTKNQEASYNFKLGFALSKRPHFNSVYLARVPFLTGIAVPNCNYIRIRVYSLLGTFKDLGVCPAQFYGTFTFPRFRFLLVFFSNFEIARRRH